MRLLLFIIPLKLIFAQDSLFWFDMSTVRDPIPTAPIILDNMYGISQIKILDSLKNMRITTSNGFRIQVYETSSSEKVKNVLNKFKKSMTDSLYVIFEAPLYKIHYGNFSKKHKAEIIKRKLKQKGYKNIWIVKSRIEQNFSSKKVE